MAKYTLIWIKFLIILHPHKDSKSIQKGLINKNKCKLRSTNKLSRLIPIFKIWGSTTQGLNQLSNNKRSMAKIIIIIMEISIFIDILPWKILGTRTSIKENLFIGQALNYKGQTMLAIRPIKILTWDEIRVNQEVTLKTLQMGEANNNREHICQDTGVSFCCRFQDEETRMQYTNDNRNITT